MDSVKESHELGEKEKSVGVQKICNAEVFQPQYSQVFSQIEVGSQQIDMSARVPVSSGWEPAPVKKSKPLNLCIVTWFQS